MNPSQTVKVGEDQQACDIFRMVNRLNLQCEIKKQNNKVEPKVEKKVEKKILSRVGYLKAIAKKTGVRKLYKGLTLEELAQKLE